MPTTLLLSAWKTRTPSQTRLLLQALAVLLALLVSSLIADPAAAQAAGGGLNSLATNVLGILQNGFVRTVAVIAVIIVGLGWLTGRVNFTTLIAVVVGIFIIFSAEWLVDQVTGG